MGIMLVVQTIDVEQTTGTENTSNACVCLWITHWSIGSVTIYIWSAYCVPGVREERGKKVTLLPVQAQDRQQMGWGDYISLMWLE